MKTKRKMLMFLKMLAFSSILLGGTFSGCLLWASRANARLPANASVGILPVGGMTLAEIEAALQAEQAAYDQLPIQIARFERRVYRPSEWGLILDVQRTYEAVRDAWSQVHPVERLFGNPQINVSPVWHLDEAAFENRLRTVRFMEKPPLDAKVEWKNGRVMIQSEQIGRKLDPVRTRKNLLNATFRLSNLAPRQMVSRDNTPPDNRLIFELAFTISSPRITHEKLKSVRGVVASYTTRFPAYQANRNNNIRLAAQALNGKVLMPGEKLSFNETVGQRSRKNGFLPAPIIVRGEKRLGIGGGICQVSSTLFNAALLADMKIVRRHNHSIPIGYVPRGRDATVTYNWHDLVVENNRQTPLVISTEVLRSSLIVRILSAPEPNRRVVIQTQWLRSTGTTTRYVNAPHLPVGTQKVKKSGSSGSRLCTLRLVYEGNRLLRKEVIATSVYNAQPRVVARGTKKAAPKPSPVSPASPAETPPVAPTSPVEPPLDW